MKTTITTIIPRLIRLLCLLLLLFLSGTTTAQQDSQYTQYMYNTQTINPAYAGNRGLLTINGLYRAQWVGLDGAPETLNLSMNTPLSGWGLGGGLMFVSDRIGPSTESTIAADFSYTIQLSERTRLSFGIKGGVNILNVDFTQLNTFNPSDPVFMDNINGQVSPIIGTGLYLHDSDRWYLGVSSPNLIRTDHYDDVAVSTASERAHFYAIGGYVFDLGSTTQFKPAVLAKMVSGAPLALDISANFLFHEKFTLGAAYRLDAAVSGLAGFQISDQLMIGYAYDYDTTELGNYNSGSHEIFLRFDLFTRVRNTVNPRFF